MEFIPRILTDAERAEKDIPDIIDKITDILVVPALVKGTHLGVKYFEDEEQIMIYLDGKDHLEIRIDPMYYYIRARSDAARASMRRAGHKGTYMRTADRRWIFSILKRLV